MRRLMSWEWRKNLNWNCLLLRKKTSSNIKTHWRIKKGLRKLPEYCRVSEGWKTQKTFYHFSTTKVRAWHLTTLASRYCRNLLKIQTQLLKKLTTLLTKTLSSLGQQARERKENKLWCGLTRWKKTSQNLMVVFKVWLRTNTGSPQTTWWSKRACL